MSRNFTQTLQDVTVTIEFSEPIRAKNLSVEISAQKLICVNKQTNDNYINGDLYAAVDVDASTWWIEDSKKLIFTLEKINKQEWWPHVLKTDPKIDVKSIKPETTKLSDLDNGTRATVEKMLFDQRQKEMGQLTSGEINKQKMLEKFKKQHPELDFSKVNT